MEERDYTNEKNFLFTMLQLMANVGMPELSMRKEVVHFITTFTEAIFTEKEYEKIERIIRNRKR